MTVSRGVRRGSKPSPILVDDLSMIPSAPKAPKELRVVGRAMWVELWDGGARWLDVKSDRALIAMICRACDALADVEKFIAEHGRYYTTPQGHHLVHPAVTDARHLSAQVVSWLSFAGFSASDRARLQIPILTVNPLTAFRERNRRDHDQIQIVNP